MATYIHTKMTDNNLQGYRRIGDVTGVVGKQNSAGSRPTRSSRNGGRHYVRSVDGLNTRSNITATALAIGNHIIAQGLTTVKRRHLAKHGGTLGVSYTGPAGSVQRTNKSVGDKSKIRAAA